MKNGNTANQSSHLFCTPLTLIKTDSSSNAHTSTLPTLKCTIIHEAVIECESVDSMNEIENGLEIDFAHTHPH